MNIASILNNIPEEWRGTTFDNSALLGREEWAKRLRSLLTTTTEVSTADLTALGNAEDYFRVSSNLSCLTEFVLAEERGLEVQDVFCFSSSVMPIVAVLLTSSVPVHLYTGADNAPFSDEQLSLFRRFGADLHVYPGKAVAHGSDVVLQTSFDGVEGGVVDGVALPSLLYITRREKINAAGVLRIRKRMSTPLTTPACEAMLQQRAGLPVTANVAAASDEELAALYAHLQEMSGTSVDTNNNPVLFAAGLSSICSLWWALVARGGADVVMASTAYGGSSELTDIVTDRAGDFCKHTFDITGENDISTAIQTTLDALAASTGLLPTTVLMVEIPTNPAMKVPPIETLGGILTRYGEKTGKHVVLLVDATFAPGSRVLEKVVAVSPGLTTMVFLSLSKSVSRGKTTAGTLVASSSPDAVALLSAVRDMAGVLDTVAMKDQVLILCEQHRGVEERNDKAYKNAVAAGNALRAAVKAHVNGYDMPLAFVSEKNAAIGFTSPTFSFNLPALTGDAASKNEGLAQLFVDHLTTSTAFKPCVSFGQDNDLVYATVPATSTQGAIKAEDKAKQAVGGVQLVRLSFPPTMDVDVVCGKLKEAVKACYTA